jgi:hypothetical protein
MANWIQHNTGGLSRDELLTIRDSMRDQRNKHRTALLSQIQFYFALTSALLTAEVTLSVFAIPSIRDHVHPGVGRAGMCVFLLVLPVGILMILRYSLQSLRKEYEKLMENLTVEQKIQAALGLLEPMQVAHPHPDRMPFEEDRSVLYPRWENGSFEYKTATEFVSAMVERSDVFYAPLRKTLYVLLGIDVALIVTIIGAAIWISFW